jgi:predicted transcriptional regulator
MSEINFKKGKKQRAQLELPTLYYVVTDDWMDKLGYEAFGVWLKFHSWVDRNDADRDYDIVPESIEGLAKRLGISKSKIYRIIKPLWEYGLVDIVEFEADPRKSQKPKNIIVYDYPLHDPARIFAKLEKLRDWNTDYESTSKEYGKTGGRPRKHRRESARKFTHNSKTFIFDRFKNKTVGNHRFKIETVTVSKIKRSENDRFKNKTVETTVSKLKPTNYNTSSLYISNISSSSGDVKSLENSVKKQFENVPEQEFEKIKSDILKDIESGSLVVETASQYEGILRYRLSHWKPTIKPINATKPSKQRKVIRKEPVPDWIYNQNKYIAPSTEEITPEEFERQKRELEERLKKYDRSNKNHA